MRGGPTSGGPGQLESPYWEAPNGPDGTVPLAPGIELDSQLRWSGGGNKRGTEHGQYCGDSHTRSSEYAMAGFENRERGWRRTRIEIRRLCSSGFARGWSALASQSPHWEWLFSCVSACFAARMRCGSLRAAHGHALDRPDRRPKPARAGLLLPY